VLDAALAKVIASHPELRGFALRSEALEAEGAVASLRPEMSLGLSIENALGSGDYRGFDSAESTLTLAGLIERGGKREARRAMASARFDALGVERSAMQFDVLAETARRYLDVVGWQARQPLLEAELAQRERMAEAARKRFAIGAAPEAMALKAEADVAATKAALAATRGSTIAAARKLALMWSDRSGATFEAVPLPSAVPPLPTTRTSARPCRPRPSWRALQRRAAYAMRVCGWRWPMRRPTSIGNWACGIWRGRVTSRWSLEPASRWVCRVVPHSSAPRCVPSGRLLNSSVNLLRRSWKQHCSRHGRGRTQPSSV
jgi:cobalt-zinc-cadmium efflux system outer membrane protein